MSNSSELRHEVENTHGTSAPGVKWVFEKLQSTRTLIEAAVFLTMAGYMADFYEAASARGQKTPVANSVGLESGVSPEHALLSTEEMLESLAGGIPGAADVQTYPAPGAKQLIVHIRNVHGMEWMIHDRMDAVVASLPETHKLVVDRLLAGEDLATMNYPWLGAKERKSFTQLFARDTMQRLQALHAEFADSPESTKNVSIRRICAELLRRYGASTVCCEGISMTEARRLHLGDYDEVAAAEIAALQELQASPDTPPDERAGLLVEEWELRAQTERIRLRYERTLGAVHTLFASGQVSIGPSHSPKAERHLRDLSAAVAAGEKLSPEQELFMYEGREEDFLEVAKSLKHRIVPVVFGGGHDWSDTVARWNSTHPEHILSLVVLTPEGLGR